MTHTPQFIPFILQFEIALWNLLLLLTSLFSVIKHCKNCLHVCEWERESQPSCMYPLYLFFSLFIFCQLWSEWERCYSFFVFLSLSLPFFFSSTKSTHLVCKVAPLASSTPSFLFLFLLSPMFPYLSLPPAHAFATLTSMSCFVYMMYMCFSTPLISSECC